VTNEQADRGLDGKVTSYHFGYNCTNYLPTLGKCRVFIGLYTKRADLLSYKWLKTRELLLYTGSPREVLLGQIGSGAIKTKRVKVDGSLRYLTPTSWAWDDCPLADAGGQCLHFEPHDSQQITCLMDLEHLDAAHPNAEDVPSLDDVRLFEERLSNAVVKDPEAS
jgi:hypothetical protein